MLAVTTVSTLETERLGAALARLVGVGDVVAVRGELGAGKTALIRGACRELGVSGRVTSPTFTIGHRYEGRVEVAHLDLYRFASISAAEWADIEPLLEAAVAFVEWPDVGQGFLPEPVLDLTLQHVSANERSIEITSSRSALLEALTAAVREGSALH